ncbi:MAG: recombinase family protein, partial [Chloroflexota bacterium]
MSSGEAPLRAVLYARVSTDQQAGRDHFSIAAQFNEMREYAQQRRWQITGEFVDEGLSGEKWDRPALETILEMATQGSFDILLVHELSRLSRSVYHTLEIFDVLGQHNLGFASVKDPDFDFADPAKRLFLVILAAINQYYLDILRMHIRKSKRQRARAGLYNAAVVPYGYRLAGTPKDPPVIVPEEAEVVKLAYEQYATGKVSHMEIAEMLNTKEYRTRPVSDAVKGRQFSKDTVSSILRNQFYMGKVVYKRRSQSETEVFDGQHEPIISADLWEVVQKAHTQRRSGSRSMQKPFRVYLLSWLARCDVCGRKLRCQATTKEYTYYREVSLERGFQDCPHTRLSTRTEPVDQYIHALIAEVGLPKEWLEEVVERLTADSELDGLQRKRKSLENRRRRLKEMKITGDFDEDTDLYYREMARVQRELARIPSQTEIEGLKDATATLQDLPEIWAKAEAEEQRDLLRSMVKEVGVDVALDRV